MRMPINTVIHRLELAGHLAVTWFGQLGTYGACTRDGPCALGLLSPTLEVHVQVAMLISFGCTKVVPVLMLKYTVCVY